MLLQRAQAVQRSSTPRGGIDAGSQVRNAAASPTAAVGARVLFGAVQSAKVQVPGAEPRRLAAPVPPPGRRSLPSGAESGGRTMFGAEPARERPSPSRAEESEGTRPPAGPIWEHPDLPAGSGYSKEEWAAARSDGGHIVEFVTATERSLIRLNVAPSVAKRAGASTAAPVDGREPMTVLMSLVGSMFDGCMVLGPGARVDYPNHCRAGAIVLADPFRAIGAAARPGVNFTYSIVEPRAMVNEVGRGAVLRMDLGGETLPAFLGFPEERGGEELSLAERDRPRA